MILFGQSAYDASRLSICEDEVSRRAELRPDECPCGGHMIEVGEGADEHLECDECGEVA